MGFGTAALILDGNEGAVLMDFNDIANAAQAVGIRPDGEAAGNAHTRAALAESGVRLLVERVAFGSRVVLRPESLNMNERALPRTIQVVLESGEGDCG